MFPSFVINKINIKTRFRSIECYTIKTNTRMSWTLYSGDNTTQFNILQMEQTLQKSFDTQEIQPQVT